MKFSRRCLISKFPVALVTLPNIACTRPSKEPGSTPERESLHLAEMTLEELHRVYQKELQEDLGFWDKHGVDMEHGGFMCSMDHDGTLLSTEKNIMFQGRGLWVYSFLYRHFGKNRKHFDIARKVKEFLFKHARQQDSTWADVVSREGTITTPFQGNVYSGLYVAEGLHEYSQASGDKEAHEVAVRTLLKCMDCYEQASYGNRTESYPVGSRQQGVEMIVIPLLTQMLQSHPDSQLEKFQARAMAAVTQKFFNPRFRLHNEILRHDYSRYEDEKWRDYVHLGFSIANFWGILLEAVRLKDRELFGTVADRLHRHLEVAWDEVYGGLGWSMQIHKGCVDYRKASYVHGEAMIGLLTVIERLGSPWARDWYARIHRYAFENFPIRRYPGWHSYMDRHCTPQEHVTRRENYHHPRYLMLSLQIIDRLIERAGRAVWW